MKKTDTSTKDVILAISLDMFSNKGCNAVSIRDIGKAVGIKESSIYYHFVNKNDILVTLLRQADQFAENLKNKFNNALAVTTSIKEEAFVGAGVAYLEKYLLNEQIYKLIRMLTIEKQTNEEAARIYHDMLFKVPLDHQENVYKLLIERGYIAHDTPAQLASEYQAIILFVFQKYFSGCIITPESKIAARDELQELLKRIYKKNFVKEQD